MKERERELKREGREQIREREREKDEELFRGKCRRKEKCIFLHKPIRDSKKAWLLLSLLFF